MFSDVMVSEENYIFEILYSAFVVRV